MPLIHILRDGGVEDDVDASLLVKREGSNYVEYYLDGRLVHRSVSIELRPQIPLKGEAGTFSAFGRTWSFGDMNACDKRCH